MTMTNTFTIDLDRSEFLIDLQSDVDELEPAASTVTDNGAGPLVIVSDDRFVGLELILFAGLAPQDDVVQLDSAADIASHIRSCDALPSLFMIAGSVMADARLVLAKLGLEDIDVIGI